MFNYEKKEKMEKEKKRKKEKKEKMEKEKNPKSSTHKLLKLKQDHRRAPSGNERSVYIIKPVSFQHVYFTNLIPQQLQRSAHSTKWFISHHLY